MIAEVFTVFSVVFGLIFLFFVPGYALALALFPRKDELGLNFEATGGYEHTFNLSVEDGITYKLYYRCKDVYGNENSESIIHSFTVASKWWDNFEDESKVSDKNQVEISDGAKLIIPENKIYPTEDATINRIVSYESWMGLAVGSTGRYRIR